MKFGDVLDGGRIAATGLRDFAVGLGAPALRLGVTGLARSGKTVFITALVRAIVEGNRLPQFGAASEGRIVRAYLEPQPDDAVPRFPYEDHLAALTAENRRWPESTRRLSQLRLTLEFAPRGFIARNLGRGMLHVDIVDYPGEWLLDLPLLKTSYARFAATAVAASRQAARAAKAKAWHAHLATLDANAPADESTAIRAAELFTDYLAACREDSFSTVPPGRFLMPGDFAGSPLLNFAPLDVEPDAVFVKGSLGVLMARRYDSYVARIVKPFFLDHFARLDRQIVLVDALSALNAGPEAVKGLRAALADILACFRPGSNSLWSALFGRRIDRILFAATKADLLHRDSHDRLAGILRLIVEDAARRADFAGAEIEAMALAAIRATREARARQRGGALECIAGTPERGESLGALHFDGATEAAIFPGDLPAEAAAALGGSLEGALKFVRFRPPLAKDGAFPHIRLDSAIEFLIGDRLA